MKKIENKVTKEVVETTFVYQAADGTQFFDEKQCELYEQSAACVLLAKLNDCTIAEEWQSECIDCSDDNDYHTLIPTTQEHLDVMNQLWFMHGGKDTGKPKFSEKDLNTVILMGTRHYNHKLDWCWFYKLNEVISEITANKFVLMPVP